MRGNDILHEHGNEENLKKLIALKTSLVPFIGAGFSVPACPAWAKFLDLFFNSIKDEFDNMMDMRIFENEELLNAAKKVSDKR